MNRIAMAGLCGLLGALVLGGCDKKVDILVTNTLPEPARNVTLNVQGGGIATFGTMMPGESAKYKVKINKDFLPAKGVLRGSGFAGDFTIYENTKSPLSLYIDPSGVTTVRKHDTIQSEIRSDSTRTVQQDTVVVPPPAEGGGRVIQQDTIVE